MDPKLLNLIYRWQGTRDDRERLKLAIEDGLDINAVDDGGQNVLHWIARHLPREPYEDLARALVEQGADRNRADIHGNLPLHYACAYAEDSSFVFNGFLQGADVNHANHAGETPLHWTQCAMKDEHGEITRILLEAGARLNSRDGTRRSPLHWAMAVGHTGGVVRLLRAGANPDAVDRHGRTPVYWAVRRARGLIMSGRLVRGGTERMPEMFNQEAEKARTDCDPAYGGFRNSGINREGAMLLLQLLADRGADFERADREAAALLHEGQSMSRFHAEEVIASPERFLGNLLVGYWPRLDDSAMEMLHDWLTARKEENGGRLPRWCCTGEPAEKLAEVMAGGLGKRGIRWLGEMVDGGLDLGATQAVVSAIRSNRWRTLKWLISRAPELVHAAGRYGETPLHAAASYGRLKCALELLSAGADVHARDKGGRTPLHEAAPYYDRERDDEYEFTWTKGKTDMCRLLMAAGADPHALNEDGRPTCLVQHDLLLEPHPFAGTVHLSAAQPPSEREPEFNDGEYGLDDLEGLKSLKELKERSTPAVPAPAAPSMEMEAGM